MAPGKRGNGEKIIFLGGSKPRLSGQPAERQVFADRAEGEGHMFLDGLHGQVETVGDLGMAQALAAMQQIYFLLLGRQVVDGLVEQGEVFFFCCGGFCCGCCGGGFSQAVGWQAGFQLSLLHPFAGQLAQVIEDMVTGGLEEVGVEALQIRKDGAFQPDLYKNILHYFLCGGEGFREAVNIGSQALMESIEQQAEGRLVSFGDTAKQFFFNI